MQGDRHASAAAAAMLALAAVSGGLETRDPVEAAERLMAAGRYTAAERTLKLALQASPAGGTNLDVNVSWTLASLFDRFGRREEAQAEARRLLAFCERVGRERLSGTELATAGLAAALTGDRRQALELATMARMRAARDRFPFVAAGRIYADTHDKNRALQAYAAALRLDAKDSEALTGLGTLYLGTKGRRKAQRCFREALAANPDHVPALRGLARFSLLVEEPQDVFRYCREALSIQPGEPETLTLYAAAAALYDEPALYSNAVERLAETAGCNTNAVPGTAERIAGAVLRARLLAETAAAFHRRRRVEKAMRWCRRAVDADPLNAGAAGLLGWNLARQFMDREATAVLKQARELDPYDPGTRVLLHALENTPALEETKGKRARLWLHADDAPVLEPYAREAVEATLARCEKIFNFSFTNRLRVVFLTSDENLSCRAMRRPQSRLAGVSFGRTVLALSPGQTNKKRPPWNWERGLRHEVTHCVTLKKSRYRIPRWLGEGCSLYMEGWLDPRRDPFFRIMVDRKAYPTIASLSALFSRSRYGWETPAAYQVAGLLVNEIVARHGEEALGVLSGAYGEGMTHDEALRVATGDGVAAWNVVIREVMDRHDAALQCHIGDEASELRDVLATWQRNPEDPDAALRALRISRHSPRLTRVAIEVADRFSKEVVAAPAGERSRLSHPVYIESVLLAGRAELGRRQWGAARAAFTTALEIDGRSAIAHFQLAKLDLAAEQTEKAEAHLRRAIELYPRWTIGGARGHPYACLADLLIAAGRFKEAAGILASFCEIHRADAGMLRRWATSCDRAGLTEAGLRAYRRLMEVSPYEGEDHAAYAALLESAGQADAAGREKRIARLLLQRTGSTRTGE